MQMMDRILFNPKVNNTLAALDDPKSMFSVAARDALDSSGRTVMEYKRDTHGGRERLLEEFCTFVIWGFGVRAMKQLYDAAILHTPGLKKMGIKLPDLDLALLSKAKPGVEGSAQVLQEKWVDQFQEKFGNEVDHYKTLQKLLKSESTQDLYRYSNIVKFGVASAVPALFIALGIPTFNQWLTRRKLAKEHANASQGHAAAPKNGAMGSQPSKPVNSRMRTGVAPMPLMPMMGSARIQPSSFPVFGPGSQVSGGYGNPFQYGPTVNNAWKPMMPMGNPPTRGIPAASPFVSSPSPMMGPMTGPANPWAAAAPNVPFSGGAEKGHPAAPHQSGAVRFGATIPHFSDVASEILQHERWQTLFLDGTISSGRVYKARNNTERLEIAFRETAIIAFLYWIQRPIQDFIGKQLGKRLHIPSELEFKTIQYLHKRQHNLKQFKSEFQDGLKALHWDDLEKAEDKHTQLVEKIYKYFLKDRDIPANKNLVLETAIDGGWIPTFGDQHAGSQTLWEKLKSILHDINPVKEQQLTQNKYLDLTKKIDTEAIFSLKKHLESLTEHSAQELDPLLKRVMRLRGSAWFLSNALCFAVLSGIIPSIQHYITYKTTGKNYFPGVQQS